MNRPKHPAARRLVASALFAVVAASTTFAPTSTASAEGRSQDVRPGTDAVVLAPLPDAKPQAGPPSTGDQALDDAAGIVDVAFVYPAALAAQADVGGVAGLRAKFATAIAGANTAFVNSGIPLQLRNVGDRQVAAATTADLDTMLEQLYAPGDGVYDEAQALREETHADLVTLWASGSVPLGSSCGMGALGGAQPAYDPDSSAWTVMFYTACADKYRVFEHEIGHNLGGDHDAAASFSPNGSKPYARGYTDPAHRFITVMAYYDTCTAAAVDCTRIPYFSSPTVRTPEGWATGTAAADNVRAITEQAPAVANYRQSQIYPAAPVIEGRANRGKRLTATTPGWTPANVTFAYQWTSNGVPIAGATSSTLRLGKAQVGTSIAVTVTGSAPYYQPVAAGSTATGPVAKRLFKRTHRPRIRGAARPGARLHAAMKDWKPAKKVRYRFQWLRDGKRIKHAKGRDYRVTRKDRGKKISVKVTGKRKGYETATRTSRKVKVRR